MTIEKKSRSNPKIAAVLEQDRHKLAKPKKLKYKLTRESDGLTKMGYKIKWVALNSKQNFNFYNEPAIGRSLLLDPGIAFTWFTTPITELFYTTKSKIRFKTNNSIYILEILK
jgi:hypothetical protein